MKFFDSEKKQIVHTGADPGSVFWDNNWKQEDICVEDFKKITKTIVSKITKKYLDPEDGKILEGGCGTAGNVFSLDKAGYAVVGVDFAEETVNWLNINLPELTINTGDVRDLQFEDGSFAGYWSLGVIEHFKEGYEKIALEMYRVIQEGGYLFVSFPYMSPLRKLKVFFGRYKIWKNNEYKNMFYEYFLNADSVIEELENIGFVLVKKYPLNSIKGTKDEVNLVREAFQVLHDYKGESLFVKVIKRIISGILIPFAGHSLLLVMRKN